MRVPIQEMTREEIFRLTPLKCGWTMSREELETIFMACDAFWHHPGNKNPGAPHAELTSGKHSNFYINCPRVLEDSNLCQIMARQLFHLLLDHYHGPIHWVVGSDSSALGLSKDLANLTRAKWRPLQKKDDDSQAWEKGVIQPGEKVLHIEELLTTSGTTQAVRKGIRENNPYPVDFVPFIPVLVHRPDKGVPEEVDGSRLIYLLHYDTYAVDPKEQECELCKNGSPALPAKENWDELINSM